MQIARRVILALSVVTITTDLLFQKFLAADYETSQQVIDTATGQVARLNPPIPMPSGNQGMLEKMKGWWSENVDVKTRFDNLKHAAEQATPLSGKVSLWPSVGLRY